MADEDVDPVTKKLKETGCLEINTKLQVRKMLHHVSFVVHELDS